MALLARMRKPLASLQKAHQMCRDMGIDYYLTRTEKALEWLKR